MKSDKTDSDIEFLREAAKQSDEDFPNSADGGRLRDIADALAAMSRRSSEAPEGWRDIATAPKNKSVLVVLEGGNKRVLYQTDHGEGLMDTWRNPEDGTQAGWPTHWQPLPASPLPTAKGSET